jgi:hypothetical protein
MLNILCSQDSSLGIEAGYGLDGRVRYRAGATDFYLLHSVQTASGAHLASFYTLSSGGSSAPAGGLKRPRHEADHSPPPGAEVSTGGVIPPLPHASSWRGA